MIHSVVWLVVKYGDDFSVPVLRNLSEIYVKFTPEIFISYVVFPEDHVALFRKFKLVFLGEQSVGKTSLITRFFLIIFIARFS